MNAARKPTFNNNPQKTFQERSSSKSTFSKRREKTAPLSSSRTMESVKIQQLSELTLTNAKGTGNVNVVVKQTQTRLQPKVKKTGALSPRAPEKIKKNRAEEMKVCGENACLAIFEKRPESIVRLYLTVNMAHKMGELLSYLAAHKKVYHVVDNAELSKVSGSEHHGGIAMLVKKPKTFTLDGYLSVARERDLLVLLHEMQNAQNIGSVLRTCAIFGLKNVLCADPDAIFSSTALRVAEGGAESLRVLQCGEMSSTLAQLRAQGYQVVYVSSDSRAPLFSNVKFAQKVVLVLAENEPDLHDLGVRLAAPHSLRANLNVAVSAGILLAHLGEK